MKQPYITWKSVEKWVDKIPKNERLSTNRTLKDEVAWFCAITEANIRCECYGTKDWAHVLLNGHKPITPMTFNEWFCCALVLNEEELETVVKLLGHEEAIQEYLLNYHEHDKKQCIDQIAIKAAERMFQKHWLTSAETDVD